MFLAENCWNVVIFLWLTIFQKFWLVDIHRLGTNVEKKKISRSCTICIKGKKTPLSKNKYYSFLKRSIFLIFSLYYQICLRMKIFLPTLWSFQLYSFIKSFPHLILFLYMNSDWKKKCTVRLYCLPRSIIFSKFGVLVSQ